MPVITDPMCDVIRTHQYILSVSVHIMSLSDRVLYFTGQMDTPLWCLPSYVQLCFHPATRTWNRSQRKNRQNVTMSLVNSKWKWQWQCHGAHVLQCQMPKTRRTVGDKDQCIKHSDDDRQGLTWPTYYCTVLCILWSLSPFN